MVKYYIPGDHHKPQDGLSLPKNLSNEAYSQHLVNYTPYIYLCYDVKPQQTVEPNPTLLNGEPFMNHVNDQPFKSKILFLNYTIDGHAVGIVNQNGVKAAVKIQQDQVSQIFLNSRITNCETESEFNIMLTKKGLGVFALITNPNYPPKDDHTTTSEMNTW